MTNSETAAMKDIYFRSKFNLSSRDIRNYLLRPLKYFQNTRVARAWSLRIKKKKKRDEKNTNPE